MSRPIPTPIQAADAIGDLVGFALSTLPAATRQEIGLALKNGKGTLEIILTARSPTDYEQRVEFHNGKRNRVLQRTPMKAPGK